ncbi:MAG: DUF2807 domain-containing protein [Pseudonocardia sp.]|nr:DUF2807 domain-containing protein [Pseudonocardia sp.]
MVVPCTMRRCWWVVILATVVAVAGCATGPTVSGSGDAGATATPASPAPATAGSVAGGESREVHGVTGVELASFGELQIDQTGTESLTIEADPDVLPKLTSGVSGGILRLRVAPGTTIKTAEPVVYHLTVAGLNSIAVAGAGSVTASNLQADHLAVDISGAGRITLAGTVDSQAVTISGTGNYDGENLQSATADVTVDGAAKAVVRVSTRLNATVDGVGAIQYVGSPQVTRKINGVGSVTPR